MTDLLYLNDSYLKECEAIISNVVERKKIILDKTAFFPVGGGQPSDTGKLIRVKDNKEFTVVNASKESTSIIHEIQEEGLEKGDSVKAIINWERRYKHMRMHTAVHILCNIINKETNALITGNQIGEDKTRVDFSLETFDRDLMKSFEDKTNEVINKNLDISISYMNREEALQIPGMVKLAKVLPPEIKELRVLSIGDFDMQADGGTHVKNTQEIKGIKIISLENKGKDRRRIYFELIN